MCYFVTDVVKVGWGIMIFAGDWGLASGFRALFSFLGFASST